MAPDIVTRTQSATSSSSSESAGPGKDSEVTLTVEVVSAKDLPLVGFFTSRRKYYVVLKVDEDPQTAQHTKRAEGTWPQWKQTFSFAARRSSIITFEVFADRTLQDEVVGRLSESVASFTNTDACFERKLLPGPNATLKFSVKVGVADAQEILHQALQNTGADISSLTTPQPAALLNDAVDTGGSVVEVVQSVVNDWQPLLDKMQIFCKVMDGVAEVHPYANMAWSILSGAYKVFKQQLDRDGKIRSLYTAMDALYMLVYDLQKNLENNQVDIQADVIVRIARQTTECCYFIRSYASDPGFVKRMAKNTFSGVDQRIQDYCSSFEALRQAFYAKLHVETRIVVTRVLSETQNINIKLDLNDLPYAGGAALCPRDLDEDLASPDDNSVSDKMCLPGTRVDLLQEIEGWINQDADDAKRVLLLTGAAGTGKSAIAHTIAHRFAALGRLGASFAFNRNQKERTPDKLFPTLARDMADFDPNMARALYSAIEENKALRTTTHLDSQFTHFIVKPTKELSMIGPIVFVIDALDECGDALNKSRRELISLLSRRIGELPPNFRILITTRPEHDIVSQVHGDHTQTMSMHSIKPETNTDDIRLYVRSRLLSNPPIPLDGIDEACCNNLASSSQGLFQWAYVACDTIVSAELSGPGVTARERYDELIQSSTGKTQANVLDSLYTKVLSQLFEGKETSLARFKAVMELVLASFEPPSLDTLNTMLHHSGDTFDAKTIVSYLGALLSGVASSDEPIRPLHTSFRDFLTDKSRSGIFFVDSSAGHHDLALASLRVMQVGLKFNLCGFESSYKLNEAVLNMDEVAQFIPGYLSYASRFWSSHLKASVPDRLDSPYLDALRAFLCEKLLFWFEILSVLDEVSIAAPALSFLARQTSTLELEPGCSIARCARDARKFVETFGAAISQSAPHIYLSALPLSPTTSIVKRLYSPHFSRTLRVCKPYDSWPVAQNVINAQMSVKSAAVSPDGLYIASVGSSDEADQIHLWDMNTGKWVVRSFPEQPRCLVVAVTFSPDGRYICTCSSQDTVHVWNMETGEVFNKVFAGDDINSVSFNPGDASYVVSSAVSGMIRVWHAVTGDEVAHWTHNELPQFTYGSRVSSIAWSADGALIASGGEDEIARIWNAATGKLVGQPLTGHKGLVTSVAFSPDNKWLASGSYDETVRLWDIGTCSLLGAPLVPSGKSWAVESVTFSPDSCYLASASGTVVFLWDLTKIEIPRYVSLTGHTACVCSVAYSPDGAHLVSGADDGTVRIWDTDAGIPAKGLEKHTGAIISIAFSPDGRHVVSGSEDRSVRVWDILTGQHSNIPTAGRAHITSVAISPDGKIIAFSSWDNVIELYDADTLKSLFPPLEGHDRGVRTIAFLSGYFISTCSEKILLWDSKTGDLAANQLQAPEVDDIYYERLVVSSAGPYIAAGSTQSIFVWNVDTLQLTQTLRHDGHGFLNMIISSDGEQLLSSSPNLTRLWNVETAESTRINLYAGTEWMGAAAFSPDGANVACSDMFGGIYNWKLANTATPCYIGCNIGITTALAYSPDGKRLASGGEDGKVQIWDVAEDNGTGPAVLFSHDISHALQETNLIADTPLHPVQHFILKDDGWMIAVVGHEERLLFWVPVEQRDTLVLPVRKTILGGEPCELDLSKFVHGPKWTQCYTPYNPKNTDGAGGNIPSKH